jgi:hypothetical protein
MPFWEQPTPALANWRSLGEAISLNEHRPAVNRAACDVVALMLAALILIELIRRDALDAVAD